MSLSVRLLVHGHLSENWSAWFAGLQVQNRSDGSALLFGILPDIAALYGAIDRLRDLNVMLFSLTCSPVAQAQSREADDPEGPNP